MESLVHFQHGELTEERAAEIVDHLAVCEPCSDRASFEDRMLAELRDRLPRVAAPPGLRTRIVAALDEAAPDSGSRPVAWWRAPWVAAAVASVLLVGLLAVGMPGSIEATDAGAWNVLFHGTIVDHQCDLHGASLADQRDCADPSHTNALKLDDGTYVQFGLHDAGSRGMVLDAAQRGRRVAAQGRYYRGIRTLAVTDVRDAGPVEL